MNLSGGVLLGHDGERPRKQLFVPSGYDSPLLGRCLIPGCDRVFERGEEDAWQRHVVTHAEHDIDELRALAPSVTNRGTIFAEDRQDRELEKHFRGVAERMAREGRVDTRPSERAAL